MGGRLLAARALLRLTQAEVARRAGVSVVTVRGLERDARVAEAMLAAVRRVLERLRRIAPTRARQCRIRPRGNGRGTGGNAC